MRKRKAVWLLGEDVPHGGGGGQGALDGSCRRGEEKKVVVPVPSL